MVFRGFHMHKVWDLGAGLPGRLTLTEAPKTIAAAIVDSRLHFCNSLLAGTSALNLHASSLSRIPYADQNSDLHWLPVRHRISFKLATIAFNMQQYQQPSYLASLIPRDVLPSRALRSSPSLSIFVPYVEPPWQLQNRFHLLIASNIWNALPNHLSSIPTLSAFRRALKHHLFLLCLLWQ